MRQAMPSVRYTASRHISLAAIFLVLLSLCAASPGLATDSVIRRNTAFARETLALINAERQKAGYTLMAEDAKLNATAKERLANPVMKTRLSDNRFTKNGVRYTFQGKYTNARRIVD